ncbi:vacuolar protein sorting/targeting protein 10 [Aspergillus ruber CBS 135680]|uniref:Vacuolar protein sorting/targeting protein 10 n=1 Tax=Aspergillus ruber (strain CBS 135680) TaxID=1388766 RepID=A0A017SA36_ASPRC|nr:vacuolar protein sorting protein [Aspergillus ruber CBS 135680]EYE93807.1 vacuolar protein sorting protein [Aspergillus ruber CBS 135680]
MIPRWLLVVSCLLWALIWQPVAAKKDNGPTITATELEHEPVGLFYFEDTDTILFQDVETGDLLRSFDGGEKFDLVEGENGDMKGQLLTIWPHPFDTNKAYVFGKAGKHWVTTDQGKTFDSFEVEMPPAIMPLAFHGWDSKKVIFHGEVCFGFMCANRAYYTTDDFKTIKPLRDGIVSCAWAVGDPQFAADLDIAGEIEDRILCVVPGLKISLNSANRLVYSDDYFKSSEDGAEVKLQHGRPVSGVISTAAVKKYLVAAAQSQGTDEHALFVSDDSITWHRAEFGNHRLEEDAYTILESTNYSIQVGVLTSSRSNGMGTLFTSNSNGTYFTNNIEHVNRNPYGFMDFEKIANIQGIVLVNTVKNPKEVEDGKKKKIVSEISFDDGRSFQSLKLSDEKLHLHSVTAFANMGRVFSSPAPGIVMGVGNTGDHLKDYSEGNLYVSDDAGVTWRLARKGPHKYEFGDQGAVIMAIRDDEKTDEIWYSIDHGKDWESAKLKHKIYPRILTTTPDSTSLKFLLVGSSSESSEDGTHIIYSIDYNGLHERKCGKDDFETWPARLDEKREADCLMGHKQYFKRRKANADCFVDEEFKDPEPIFKPCKCTAEDFECDFNFVRSEDRKSCKPAVSLTPPKGECQKPDDTYKGPSGWRLIPGNTCIRDGGENLDADIERSCDDAKSAPAYGSIAVTKQTFDSRQLSEHYYLERQSSSSQHDETIIMITEKHVLHISHDHGKNWKQPLKGEKVVEIIPHPYYTDVAYFLTEGTKSFYTDDRRNVKSFKTPTERRSSGNPLAFHPQNKGWLIWIGPPHCTTKDCHSDAYFTTDSGTTWKPLLEYTNKCMFVGDRSDGKRQDEETRKKNENLILCEQYENEDHDSKRQLVYSDDFFAAHKDVQAKNVVGFAAMYEYIIVATDDPEHAGSLKASVSIDGRTFAEVEFPVNLNILIQSAYTIVDSATHAVFLHVTRNENKGAEYGSLIKSNSNGTSYVLSLPRVNRNSQGYIDFEKMQGLEGVAVANVVENVHEVVKKGESKKLKTMITHNDGAQWTLLSPPSRDADNNKFGCSVKEGRGTDDCALHLHGYTERKDPEDTFASGSAIGLMMGVGNVGDSLGRADNADTFLTRDGGITWKSVKKGRYHYEYGDAGSVIVIVSDHKPTKVLYYTLDEGDTWEEFQFSETEVLVDDITTLPSDTSKNFLLWVRETGKDKFATVNVDFSGLREKGCHLDELEKEGHSDDYYLWEPTHPLQADNCLFGHTEQYHRKKISADCWNNWREPHVHSIGRNCTCTRADYECDYNYEPQSDGSCKLVPGLPEPDALAVCRDDPDEIEYWEPTGYRRIPLTTCQGGLNLDHHVSKPCPSKEKEYEEKHGVSGTALFFAITIPIALACAAGYYVYTRWDGKFGQIRLGEGVGGTEGWLSRDSPVVTVPIALIAGVVAIAKALPLLVSSLWRSVSGYVRIGRGSGRPYASRGSFAARRGDYAHVVDDEDELLGVDEAEDEEDEA